MGPKTPKLLANETLYQLSYDPIHFTQPEPTTISPNAN